MVWQRSLKYTLAVHQLTTGFPSSEQYVLGQQMKRAADSICLNIAEGSTGQTNKEFARFISIASRSAYEVVACLHIGKLRGLVSDKDFETLHNEAEEIIKMLHGLRKSVLQKVSTD